MVAGFGYDSLTVIIRIEFPIELANEKTINIPTEVC